MSSPGLFTGAQLGFHSPGRDWIVRGAFNWDFELFSDQDVVGGFGVL